MLSTDPVSRYFSNQDLKAWPMRFGDAALNTGKKPEASYNQYGGTAGGPHRGEQGLLLRQLRGYEGPSGRRPDGHHTYAVDASG